MTKTAYKTRPRDFAFMSWIKSQQCAVCEKNHTPSFGTVYAHHAGQRGIRQKAEDRTCIPLCWRHHDRNSSTSIHSLGKRFWGVYGLDRAGLIADYSARYDLEMGEWRIAA